MKQKKLRQRQSNILNPYSVKVVYIHTCIRCMTWLIHNDFDILFFSAIFLDSSHSVKLWFRDLWRNQILRHPITPSPGKMWHRDTPDYVYPDIVLKKVNIYGRRKQGISLPIMQLSWLSTKLMWLINMQHDIGQGSIKELQIPSMYRKPCTIKFSADLQNIISGFPKALARIQSILL